MQDNDSHNYFEESERGSAKDASPSRGLLQGDLLFDLSDNDIRSDEAEILTDVLGQCVALVHLNLDA